MLSSQKDGGNAPVKRVGVIKTPQIQPQTTATAGQVQTFVETAPTEISNRQRSKESRMALVSYIAGRANSFMRHVIYTQEGSKKYKALYEAEMKKDPKDRIMQATKLKQDGKPTTETIDLTKEYSQTKLHSFFGDAYQEIWDADYKKVVLSETKPEYVIIKNLLDKDTADDTEYVSLNEKLCEKAAFFDLKTGLFGIKRKDLIAIMVATSARHIPILCGDNQDPTKPNGYVITESKKSGVFDLLYLKRDLATAMQTQVKTLIEIGVPYAINKDFTIEKGTIGDVEKVINRKQVEELYGKNFKYNELGVSRKLSKADYPNEEEYEKAKAETVVQFSKKGLGRKFEEIGLTEENVKDLRKKGHSTRKGLSIEELYEAHFNNLHDFALK